MRGSTFGKFIDNSPGNDKLTRAKVKFLPELFDKKILRQEKSKIDIVSFRQQQ